MPLLLLLLFVVVPVVEIYVIIQVGQLIGVVPTIVLLVADAVLGTWLFRREARRTWSAFREALAAHRVPAKEVADGALVILGGAFLLTWIFLLLWRPLTALALSRWTVDARVSRAVVVGAAATVAAGAAWKVLHGMAGARWFFLGGIAMGLLLLALR